MSGRSVGIALAAATAVVALWYVVLFAPMGNEQAELRQELEQAETAQAELQATRGRLQRVATEVDAWTADLSRLDQLVPSQPEVGTFIDSANDVARRAGVRWVSVSPTPAVADARTGLSTISVTLQVEGTFFALVAYLQQMENLPRLVIVDSIDITRLAGDPGGELAATLGLRVFTSAPAAAAAGTSGAPVPATSAAVPADADEEASRGDHQQLGEPWQ